MTTHIRHHISLLVTTFCLLATPAAWAQWASTSWQLNTEKSSFECVFCTQADKDYKRAYDSALGIMDKWVSSELQAISKWMSGMGYRQPKLPVTPGPFYVYPSRNQSEAVKKHLAGRLASYHPDDGIELNYRTFVGLISPDNTYGTAAERENGVTLAHEVYHGVQATLGTMNEENPSWYSEGMPEAVGRAWERHRHGDAYFAKSDYSQPLHQPDDIYSRAHFFYMLGKDLRSSPYVAYFKDLDHPSSNDGQQGLSWINHFLSNRIAPLAEYYPRFIAEHAVTAYYFSDQDQTRYAAKQFSPASNVISGASTDVQIDTQPRTVLPVAAHYTPASPSFSGNWDTLDDTSRIYVNLLNIHEADRMQDTRLIVDRSLIPQGERYADLVYAAPGQYDPPLHVRVTNVAQSPASSSEQRFRLRLETARININLPVCLSPGQNEPIIIDGPLTEAEKQQLFIKGQSKIHVSAGKILPDLSYTAPKSAQTVNVSLNIPTLNNRTRRVQLPSIKIQDKGCMIRLTTPELTVTYTPYSDYAEFKPSGASPTLYIKGDDIAMNDGGWQALPPMMKGMMLSSMRAGVAQSMAQIPPELRDNFQMHNLPLVFSQRFSWNTVRHAPGLDGKQLERRPISCPDQNKGCTTATVLSDGAPIQVIFYSDGSPARVMIPGMPFTFEYGGFNIGQPPGW